MEAMGWIFWTKLKARIFSSRFYTNYSVAIVSE